MFKYGFIFLVVIHGLIHLLGVAKAFSPESVTQLTHDISIPAGLLWLLTAVLLVATAVLFALKVDYWWLIGLVALLLSQVLIATNWTDAKFGTIPNIIMLVVILLTMGSYFFEKNYQTDVTTNLHTNRSTATEIITEADIKSLPVVVQQYLIYSGSVGKPKVNNMKITFQGEMRDKSREYFAFRSEQYNFFNEPARLFFMKAKIFGLTIPGYHKYVNAKASMDIRIFGLISVAKHQAGALDKAETVTVFNDMCMMAPATLIDKRIVWQEIDSQSTKATFTNRGISISAMLYFNDSHQLTNFVSDDRTDINEAKQYRFSTPVSGYKNFNGYNLPSYGEAIWHYPDGAFTYGKFNLAEIRYNIDSFDNKQ